MLLPPQTFDTFQVLKGSETGFHLEGSQRRIRNHRIGVLTHRLDSRPNFRVEKLRRERHKPAPRNMEFGIIRINLQMLPYAVREQFFIHSMARVYDLYRQFPNPGNGSRRFPSLSIQDGQRPSAVSAISKHLAERYDRALMPQDQRLMNPLLLQIRHVYSQHPPVVHTPQTI
jgi:hypothetical protein